MKQLNLAFWLTLLFCSSAVCQNNGQDSLSVNSSDIIRNSGHVLVSLGNLATAGKGGNEWYDWVSLTASSGILIAEIGMLLPRPKGRSSGLLRFLPPVASIDRKDYLLFSIRATEIGCLALITNRADKQLSYFLMPIYYGLLVAEEFSLPEGIKIAPAINSAEATIAVSINF